jgi:transcriptional regulator with PAS, ATPase and Fis domain
LPSINARLGGTIQSISSAALRIMGDYSWPGNVRELINVLEQSILKAYPRDEIDDKALPALILQGSHEKPQSKEDIRAAMKEAERNTIRLALEKTGGNKRKAAKELGISRVGLYQKLHRLKMI